MTTEFDNLNSLPRDAFAGRAEIILAASSRYFTPQVKTPLREALPFLDVVPLPTGLTEDAAGAQKMLLRAEKCQVNFLHLTTKVAEASVKVTPKMAAQLPKLQDLCRNFKHGQSLAQQAGTQFSRFCLSSADQSDSVQYSKIAKHCLRYSLDRSNTPPELRYLTLRLASGLYKQKAQAKWLKPVVELIKRYPYQDLAEEKERLEPEMSYLAELLSDIFHNEGPSSIEEADPLFYLSNILTTEIVLNALGRTQSSPIAELAFGKIFEIANRLEPPDDPPAIARIDELSDEKLKEIVSLLILHESYEIPVDDTPDFQIFMRKIVACGQELANLAINNMEACCQLLAPHISKENIIEFAATVVALEEMVVEQKQDLGLYSAYIKTSLEEANSHWLETDALGESEPLLKLRAFTRMKVPKILRRLPSDPEPQD